MITRKPRCRSGCITCRARKIKCDENKPKCIKCTSTGRKCDGYLAQSNTIEVIHATSPSHQNALIAHPSSVTSSNKLRALQFFQTRTASALCSTFDSEFWTTTVLKLSAFDPMIRNSVVAFSSLHEGFELASFAKPKREKVSSHRLLAVQHYSLAANQMQQHLSNMEVHSPTMLLVACTTLICLELLQDNYGAAIKHLEGGLSLISTYYQQTSNSIPRIPTSFEKSVMKPFSQLMVQALYLQDVSYDISLVPELPHGGGVTKFKSVLEAKDYIEACFMSAYYFFWEAKQPSATPESIAALHGAETTALSQWRESFSELLLTLGPHPSSKDLTGIEILNIHYYCLLTMLDLALPKGVPQNLTPTFIRILDLIEGLLQPSNKEQCRLPKYSFDIGIIGPLFYSSIRAPDIGLRCRAIELLRHPNIPHREGMWASGMASAMGERITTLELELVKNTACSNLEKGHRLVESVEEVESENVLDITWFNLTDLVDDAKELKVAVGLKEVGLMPHALKEGVITWDTW